MAFKEGVALLSAYRKDEALRDFARGLNRLHWTIWASSETKEYLDFYNVPSLNIKDFVGLPILEHEDVMLDGKIYSALLSRETEEDQKKLERIGIERIDLVYIDLYPLEDELTKQASNPVSIVESHYAVLKKIDIGGPTLLRAAAKGGRWVLSDPKQFLYVLDRLVGDNTENHTKFLNTLAFMAETKVVSYSMLAARVYESLVDGSFPERFREE